MTEHVVHAIEPVFDENSRVLVLGSIPSPQSRAQGFFYGHPQNRFWRVLAEVFDEPVPRTVADKRDLLLRRHIALWDVVHSCDIEGASDASIKNAAPNDLARIFETADIRAVFSTGAKAGQLYARLCEKRYGRPCVVLPSTSPANAKASLASLSKAYAEALLARLGPLRQPPVLDVKDVIALEAAIKADGTPLADLMQRAGRSLAWQTERLVEAREEKHREKTASDGTAGGENSRKRLGKAADTAAGEKEGRTASLPAHGDGRQTRATCAILCGRGNNGGDGWVAAEELAAAGFEVTVVSVCEPEAIAAQPAHDAAVRSAEALRRAKHARVLVDPNPAQLEDALRGADAIIDAMLGTGFESESVRAPLDAWIEASNRRREQGALVVAADVPSGLSAQTGKAARPCIKADATVTMIASKPGLATPYAFAFCGTVHVAPIAYIEPFLARLGAERPTEHAPARPSCASGQAPENAASAAQTCEKDAAYRGKKHEGSRRAPERTEGGHADATAAKPDEFLRPEAEDDDGYDPYSDRKPEPEPLFQQDPWR